MDTYERLRAILDSHPDIAPKAEAIDEILRILFTPQEAVVDVTMSSKAKDPELIARKAGSIDNPSFNVMLTQKTGSCYN
ncbi:MAG: hypothetical protein GX878_05425 [Firmicutes bacterium]|nr:hypothetical protein [Bacillota bacterium]